MFEIVMLIGFLAAGLAHLLPKESKEKQPARCRKPAPKASTANTERHKPAARQASGNNLLILTHSGNRHL